MKFQELRNAYFINKLKVQFVVLSKEGIMLDSSEDLVMDSATLIDKNAFEAFTFLKDLKDNILTTTKVIKLPQMEIDEVPLVGIFDFVFEPFNEDKVLWTIEETSTLVNKIKSIKQESRVNQLEKELLQTQNMKIELENKLLELNNEELERAKIFKNYFFSQVNHELRSPINGIIGLSELLLPEVSRANSRSYVESINTAAKHLKIIVNDVLDLSKIEAGELTLEQVSFELDKILEHIEMVFLPSFQNKPVELIFKIENNVPNLLKGDPTRLTQIFYNLISNAMKFTTTGSITLNVSMVKTYEKLDESMVRLMFEVRDTGKGIKPEHMKRVFQPFAQAEDTTYRLFGGTGLGLAVVKQLILLLKGNLYVESEYGVGTSFFVTLPFYVSDHTPNKVLPHVNLHDFKILVAEDSPSMLIYIKRLLEKEGAEVFLANDRNTLDNFLRIEHFDLVITDWHLPELTGMEIIDIIKSYTSNVPIMVISGSDDARDQSQHFSCFLKKPFSRSQLIDALDHVFASKRGYININEIHLKKNSFEDDVFLKVLIETLISDFKNDISDVLDARKGEDWDRVAKAIHRMRPTSEMVGALELNETIIRVEQLIKHELSYPKASTLIDDIKKKTDSVLFELKDFLRVLTQP